MTQITIFYQNFTGNMGDGWQDEYEAALAYAAHLHTVLCDYVQGVYPGVEVDVRITTERASGAGRGLEVYSDLDGRDERQLQEALGDVANRAWEQFCASATDLFAEDTP